MEKVYVVQHMYFERGKGTRSRMVCIFGTKEKAKEYIRDMDIFEVGTVCSPTDIDYKDVFHPRTGERNISSKNYGSIYKKTDTFYIREEVVK